MAFKEINDFDLILNTSLDQPAVYSILQEKYEIEIGTLSKISKIPYYEMYEPKAVVEALCSNLKRQFSDKSLMSKLVNRKTNSNYIGHALNKQILAIEHEIYKSSSMEIPFQSYVEYLLMIAGEEPIELYRKQMESFNYLTESIKDGDEQVYDSLNVLEGFIFDVEQNEVMFTPEQRTLINETIREIKLALEEKDLELAKLKLVALQMLLNMDVKFLLTLRKIIVDGLRLRDFVDYGRDFGNSLENGRSRQR